MKATVSEIAERNQGFPAEVRHPGQFRLTGPTRTDAEIVLGHGWSLYCLDVPGDRAIFVELPENTDLSTAPFVYGAQFHGAVRAATLPLGILPDLAREVEEAPNVGLLMSTGRCGSTLASRIFTQIPGVWSLSEPDWFTNLAFTRFDLADAQRDSLIAACTRLTCRPPTGMQVDAIVLKPRSEMMIQAAAYVDVLKGLHAVFLYRDCFGYVNSLYRFAQRVQGVKDPAPGSGPWEIGRQLATINAPAKVLAEYFGSVEDIQLVDLMALGWALRMRAYLEARSGGMSVAPLHYDDLTSDKRLQTGVLLESCGLDARHLEIAMKGFDRDAHSGSAGENAIAAEPISDAQRARVAELIARWGMSDYVTDRLPPVGREVAQ